MQWPGAVNDPILGDVRRLEGSLMVCILYGGFFFIKLRHMVKFRKSGLGFVSSFSGVRGYLFHNQVAKVSFLLLTLLMVLYTSPQKQRSKPRTYRLCYIISQNGPQEE